MNIGTISETLVAPPTRLTAEEFAARYEGQRVELVNGIVEELPMPWWKHGKICLRIASAILEFVDAHDLGHVVTNDSWIKVASNPDTVYGPDVMYISYQRQPRGPLTNDYPAQSPELVVEVRSPSDSWSKLLAKAAEYLNADVLVVVLLDPESQTATVCRPNQNPESFAAGQNLAISDLLPGFSCSVAKLFA